MSFALYLMMAPPFLLLVLLVAWKSWQKRDDRRDPVNIKVLRGAGDGLRERIAEHSEAFDLGALFAFAIGPVLYALWAHSLLIASGFDWESYHPGWLELMYLVAAITSICGSFLYLVRHAKAARRSRQGLNAELATAQCLNQLMAEGCLVFHDFPGEKFNIDHIVIGRGAVFSVETKSRMKPGTGGKESARVSYDGTKLRFPRHVETRPIEQARHQAAWLARFLASGVGEPVRVVPYLALPGWYVETKVPRPEVLVGNPRNPIFMAREAFGKPFDDTMKRRIAHVLAERYPTGT